MDIAVLFPEPPGLSSGLVESGWVVEALVYPSYRALWRKLASGDPKPGRPRHARGEATSSFLPR
ncbi:MAG: hypothetical protein ACRDV9_14875 [Acidimicrobiia bacterium]